MGQYNKGTNITNKIQLERKWIRDTDNYVNNEHGLIYRYKSYNAKDNVIRDDMLVINDVAFSVPPENINISLNERNINLPSLRNNFSVSLDTKQAEVLINLRVIITDIDSNRTLESEILYKLLPVISQISYMPFFELQNEYVYNYLKAHFNIDNNKILLTYQGHSIMPHPNTPRALIFNLSALMFNFRPYADYISYVKEYEIDKDTGIFARDVNDPFLLKKPESTNNIKNSKEFYRFHAPNIHFIENTILGNNTSLNLSDNQIIIGYYTYENKDKIYESIEDVTSLKKAIRDDNIVSPVEAATKENEMSVSSLISKQIDPVKILPVDETYFKGKRVDFNKIYHESYFESEPTTESKKIINEIKSRTGITFSDKASQLVSPEHVIMPEEGFFLIAQMERGNFLRKNNITIKNITSSETEMPAYIDSGYVNVGFGYRVDGDKEEISAMVNIPYNDDLHKALRYNKALPENKYSASDYWIKTKDAYMLLKTSILRKYGKAVQEKVTVKINEYMYAALVSLVYNTGIKTLDKLGILVDPANKGKELSREQYRDVALTIKYISNNFIRNNPRFTAGIQTRRTVEYYLFLLGASKIPVNKKDFTTKGVKIKYVEKSFSRFSLPANLITQYEISGYSNIARVPFSSERFATHQYMGGRVDSLTITFQELPQSTVNGINSPFILRDLYNKLEEIQQNGMTFKDLSAMDGIFIYIPTISALAQGTFFSIQDINLSTIPDVPGGEQLILRLINITKMKKFYIDRNAFRMEERYLSPGEQYKKLLNNILDQLLKGVDIKVIGKIRTHEINPMMAIGGLSPAPSRSETELSLLLNANRLEKEHQDLLKNIFGEKLTIRIPRSLKDKTGFINRYIHDKNIYTIYDGTYKKTGSKLDNALSKSSSFLVSDIIDIIYEYIYRKINILPYDDAKKLLELITNAEYVGGKFGGMSLYKQFTDSVYNDYILPPTIDPDFYFYQDRKYKSYKIKKAQQALRKIPDNFKNLVSKYNKDLIDSVFSSPLSIYTAEQAYITYNEENSSKGIPESQSKEVTEKLKEAKNAVVVNNTQVEFPTNKAAMDSSKSKKLIDKFTDNDTLIENLPRNTVEKELKNKKNKKNNLQYEKAPDIYTNINKNKIASIKIATFNVQNDIDVDEKEDLYNLIISNDVILINEATVYRIEQLLYEKEIDKDYSLFYDEKTIRANGDDYWTPVFVYSNKLQIGQRAVLDVCNRNIMPDYLKALYHCDNIRTPLLLNIALENNQAINIVGVHFRRPEHMDEHIFMVDAPYQEYIKNIYSYATEQYTINNKYTGFAIVGDFNRKINFTDIGLIPSGNDNTYYDKSGKMLSLDNIAIGTKPGVNVSQMNILPTAKATDHVPISAKIMINKNSVIDTNIIKKIEDILIKEPKGKSAIKEAVEYGYRDSRLTLLNAFPAFKVFVIEEDDVDALAWARQSDLNDFFGLNSVQEIDFVEHADQPADLLTVSFIDLTKKFTSIKYRDLVKVESKKKEKIDTIGENRLSGILLKPGTRIQLRVGYGNDVERLPIKFNGLIASVSGDGMVYNLVAQSFGVETVYKKYGTNGKKDITSTNPETIEILNWALTRPEMTHFGSWKFYSPEYLQFTTNKFGVTPLDYRRIRADGRSFDRLAVLSVNGGDINVFAPLREEFGGFWEVVKEQWWDISNLISAIFWNDFYVENSTPWDVIQEMTYRYPGYIAKVLPFGDRVTLYYGHYGGVYYYRPFDPAEEQIAQIISSSDITDDITDYMMQLLRSKTVRQFRKKWRAIGNQNLVFNKIKADYRDVYTQTQVIYDKNSNTVTLNLNQFLSGNELRTHVLKAYNAPWETDVIEAKRDTKDNKEKKMSGGGAYQYGTADLWKQSKKLYKGTFGMIVDPEIKPFDYVFIADHSMGMYGPVEVRDHVINISQYTGMISMITPSMVSYVSETAIMTEDDFTSLINGTYDIILQGDNTNIKDEVKKKFENEPLDMADFASNPATLAASIPVSTLFSLILGSVSVLSAFSGVALAAIFWLASLSLRTTIFNASKYTDPVFLRPLMVRGIPFVYGLDLYKLGTIAEYNEEQFKLITSSVSTIKDIYSSYISTLINGVTGKG